MALAAAGAGPRIAPASFSIRCQFNANSLPGSRWFSRGSSRRSGPASQLPVKSRGSRVTCSRTSPNCRVLSIAIWSFRAWPLLGFVRSGPIPISRPFFFLPILVILLFSFSLVTSLWKRLGETESHSLPTATAAVKEKKKKHALAFWTK